MESTIGVEMDFPEMMSRSIPEESYQPRFVPYTEHLYHQEHKHFEKGSTIKLSQLTSLASIRLDDDYDGYGVEGYKVSI